MRLPIPSLFNRIVEVAFGDKHAITRAEFDANVGRHFSMNHETLKLVRKDLLNAGMFDYKQNGSVLVRPPCFYSRRFEGVSFQLGGKPETER